MREPTYFVLAALLGGPLHGYGIIQRAGELSGGRVRLATGTLYTALDRLTAEGLVELVSEETVNGVGHHGLTTDGSAALRAEAQPDGPGRRPRHHPRNRSRAREAQPAGQEAEDNMKMTHPVQPPGSPRPAAAPRLPGGVPRRAGRGDPRHPAGGYARRPGLAHAS